MQLKHKGPAVIVSLTKPERTLLAKAEQLAETIGKLPCDQADVGQAAAAALVVLSMSFCAAGDEPKE